MRPVYHSFDQPMFYRVDMNIIHVGTKIRLITNQVLPIAPLPDTRSPLASRVYAAPPSPLSIMIDVGGTLQFEEG